MQKNFKTIVILGFIGWLSQTTTVMAQALDKSTIKAIELEIAPLPQTILTTADINTLRTTIIANLSQYRFPLKPENGQVYSHMLAVSVGEKKIDQTPVGISFSVGNADPRAPGFQKADVIPVQCRLIDNANPKQQAQLEMTFSGPSSDTSSQKLLAQLTENISSVCFDLLDSLKFLPPPTPEQTTASTSKPSWIPSIQVETVKVPVIQANPTPPKVASPAVALQPQPQPQPPAPAPAATPEIAAPTPAKPTVTVTSPTPSEPEQEETRKQLIIHNQGSPVILKFGYERQ